MEIADLIGNYAFPVVVCAYLLWERSTTMKRLTEGFEMMKDAFLMLDARMPKKR